MIAHSKSAKREKNVENHLFQKRFLQIRIPRSSSKKFRIKFTKQQVSPRDLVEFTTNKTLFGPQVLGTPAYPKKFDLVARPTFPRRAEVIVVELKAGKLSHQDLRQLLGYITFVRYIQTYGGAVGLRGLSEAIGFRVTKRTKISGILIGRQVSDRLMDWMPEELWHFVRICTFKLVKGNWPDDLQEIHVYDRGHQFRRRQHIDGKLLCCSLNLPQFSNYQHMP